MFDPSYISITFCRKASGQGLKFWIFSLDVILFITFHIVRFVESVLLLLLLNRNISILLRIHVPLYSLRLAFRPGKVLRFESYSLKIF